MKQLFQGCLLVDIYLMNPNQASISYYKMINSSKKLKVLFLGSKLSLTTPRESPPPDEGGYNFVHGSTHTHPSPLLWMSEVIIGMFFFFILNVSIANIFEVGSYDSTIGIICRRTVLVSPSVTNTVLLHIIPLVLSYGPNSNMLAILPFKIKKKKHTNYDL